MTTKTVIIFINGPEGNTNVKMDLNEAGIKLIEELSKLSVKNAESNTRPTIEYYVVNETRQELIQRYFSLKDRIEPFEGEYSEYRKIAKQIYTIEQIHLLIYDYKIKEKWYYDGWF